MTPVDWMLDPNLCGSTFAGPTWAEARAFVGSIYALPTSSADDFDLYQRRTGRTRVPAAAFRRVFGIARRGDGKTIIGGFLTIYQAAHRDYRPLLGPGEIAVAMLVACDRRQARQAFRYVRGLIAASPMLERLVVAETQESITLSTGVTIEVHACSYRSTRGFSLVSFVADELAFWRSEDSATPDVEVFRAVAPGLARVPGSLMVGISTPYARRGVLWQAFNEHFGKDDSSTLVWRAAGMNPTIDQALVDEALEADPEGARSEWLSEFRRDLEPYASLQLLEDRTIPERIELPPCDRPHFASVDPAGGSGGGDPMTMAIGHDRDSVAILDHVSEARPPFDPRAVVADFAATLKRYGIRKVIGDRWGGEFVRAPFREHGIEYELADRPKSDFYRDLIPLLTSGRCELLDNRRMRMQLASLERRTTRSGKDSIDHPPGAHDDLANVAAIALVSIGGQHARRNTVESRDIW